MTYRLLVLAANEDDFYGWVRRHPDHSPYIGVWPTRYHKLDGLPAFDRMAITAAASTMDAAIASCLTRVKGPDGLTPGQRLNPNEIGQEMRELNASIARHPAGKRMPGTPRPPRRWSE